jgi:hypothetical protein
MVQLKAPPPIKDTELNSFLLDVYQNIINLPSIDVPTSTTSDGTFGQMALDSGYLYVCTDTDTWKSVSLTDFSVGGYVTFTGVETLTNKTLTSPTITNPTVTTGTFTSPTITTPAITTPTITSGATISGGAVITGGTDITGVSTIGDGGTTDYTEFEADGTIVLNGDATVWKDLNMGSATLSKPAASQPDEEQFVDSAGAATGIYTLGFAIGEKVSGIFEMQHDYKQGSDFTFHLHWQGIAAPSGTDNVQWRLTYTIHRDGTTLDAVTTVDSLDTAIDTQYQCYRSDVVTITGSTAGNGGTSVLIGDQFLFTLERVASTGDVYLGDALVATVGIHYEVDTIGSRSITTK